MGESQDTLFPLDFNRSIRIEDRPERLSGDAGALILRQIDQHLGLTEWLAARLTDPRNPNLITHPQVELLRTRLYLIAQGHRDADDADRLGLDPAFRLAVSQRRGIGPLLPFDTNAPDRDPHALTSQAQAHGCFRGSTRFTQTPALALGARITIPTNTVTHPVWSAQRHPL